MTANRLTQVAAAWVTFILTCWTARFAAAESETRAALVWTRAAGAAECVPLADLERRVEGILGRRVFDGGGPADVRVRGSIAPGEEAHTWRISVSLTGSNGELRGQRELIGTAESCNMLDDSVALVVALAVDAVTPRPVRLPPPRPASAPRARWRAEVGIEGAVALSLLPGATLGAGMTVGIHAPRFWPIEANVTLWAPATIDSGGPGTHVSLWGGGLALCPPLVSGTVALSMCVGTRAGLEQVQGFGLDYVRSAEGWMIDGTLHAWLAVTPHSIFVIRTGVGAAVPILAERVGYLNRAGEFVTLHQPWIAIPEARLRLAIAIP